MAARPLAADQALVHRAAGRLGHRASILRAIMSRSPEALALGPAVISFRRRYHCPSAGAFLTGLATAVGPASRRSSRVGTMLTLLRLPFFLPALRFGTIFAGRRSGNEIRSWTRHSPIATELFWLGRVPWAFLQVRGSICSINSPFRSKWNL